VYDAGTDKEFIPRSFSIYNWGSQTNLPEVIAPLEIGAYIEQPYYAGGDRNWNRS